MNNDKENNIKSLIMLDELAIRGYTKEQILSGELIPQMLDLKNIVDSRYQDYLKKCENK